MATEAVRPGDRCPGDAATRLQAWLTAPVDGAGLGAVRIAFGLVMAAAMLRFLAKGWVERFYHEPAHHFSYAGFAWVAPLPPGWMEGLVGLAAAAALALALGWRARLAAVVFTLAFTWLELCDVSTYLNHYYLVSLLGLLCCLLPVGAACGLDARRRGHALAVRRWQVLALRCQVALVYTAAAIAKMQPDWLLEGLPLRLWLARHAELPLIGGLLAQHWVAIAAAWCGMLYDLAIPWLLAWGRSRAVAFVLVVAFHLATAVLFPIGMFPWIMIAVSLVFLPSDWPRRVRLAAAVATVAPAVVRPRPALGLVVALHLLLQAALPFRHLLHPGDVRWHEQGFRFSWRVMVMEKTGDLEYRVVDRATGEVRRVDPGCLLAPHQVKQLETQPDLILQFAHELAAREAAAGSAVAVHADCWASLNGGAPQRLIDPAVDLTTVEAVWDRTTYVLPLEGRGQRMALDR